MTGDSGTILNLIELLHNSIIVQETIVDELYSVVYQTETTEFDSSITQLNTDIVDYICYLRMLESFLLGYYPIIPDITRKPRYRTEDYMD